MKSETIQLLAALVISLTFHAKAGVLESENLQALGAVDYFHMSSTTLDRPFHVFVDLPENYAESDERYPAVYLLDGGNTFPLLAATHHYLRFGEEAPRVILVGISYGADTFREGNMRGTDFTAPSQEREFWGGAGQFQDMLAAELLPRIEKQYRADPDRRILFGHSLGGQFVLYSALTRPDLFHGRIASNPALHRNLPFYLEWRGEGHMPAPVTRLFVSSGEFDAEVFRGPARQWMCQWRSRQQRPWFLETRILPGQTHFSAVPEAFRLGLAWVLGGRGPGVEKPDC